MNNDNFSGTVTAYPLSWPQGWKRTPQREQKRARFSNQSRVYSDTGSYRRSGEVTIAVAINRVLSELRALGVRQGDSIISTNLDVRLDGLPRSGQRTPDDSGAAVYWTRNGDHRCMAIDQYDRVADNLAAIAATLSAIRAIERHGGAEILNRAFMGFAQLAAPAGSNWWDILEVDQRASFEQVKTAFRDKAKQFHPDQVDGDSEKFIQVKNAFEAAKVALQV